MRVGAEFGPEEGSTDARLYYIGTDGSPDCGDGSRFANEGSAGTSACL
jgi:hypothetical protein